MRRIANILLGLAFVGATTWFCSSDAPAPTPPTGGGGGGTSGASALQIRLFTSNANPVAGNCTAIQAIVTLNGVSVPDGTGVSFVTDFSASSFQQNGLPLISVVTTNGAAVTALCSTAAGLANVRASATIGTNTGSATISISFQPTPQVAPFFTFCNPSFGPSTGGTTLTINGGRFFGDASTTRATFTVAGVSREALVSNVTATTVTLVTPAFPEATSSSVPVAITLTFGTKTAQPVTLSLPNCFAFGTAASGTPTITAVLPSSGSNEGNTVVTILGSGFSSPVQVFFGVVEAQVLSVSFNQIVVLSPPASGAGLPNLNQNVTIRVHEVNSGLDATKDAAFRYVTALQLTAIDNNQQRVDRPFSAVTIHGQGFLSPVAVTLAGIPAKVLSVSATELLVLPGTPFLAGCTDLSGAVSVTNIDSGDTKTGLSFTYLVAQTKPIITSVSPASGSPGDVVTISGSNLGNVTTVTFGGRPATIQSVTPTSVVVTVPDNGAAAPACPAGTPTGTLLNVGTPVDIVVSSSLTTCSTTATAAFQFKLACKPAADLSIGKTASPNPVVSGDTLTYTLSINNNGPNGASNVVVSDPLPGGTSFVSCTSSQGSCTSNGNNVVARLGDLASPGFASVTIQVQVTGPGNSSITNTAVVSSDTPDTNTGNNTASVTTTVSPSATPTPTPTNPTVTPTPTFTPVPSADVSLSKSSSPSPVVSGSTLTYRIVATNNGPATATGVSVRDPLPVGTTFSSCTTSQGSCVGPSVGSNGTVIANLGSIPNPGFAVVTIVVTVTAPGGTTITNQAVVTATTPDPDLRNNTATDSGVNVTPAPGGADLSVVKTSSANPVSSGETNFTYTIDVHNGGPDPATGVIVNDPLPSGTTFNFCSTTQGSCAGPAPGTNGTVTANLGTIPSGADAFFFINVTVTAPPGSTLTNTAVASSATTDPNPANNSGTNVTSVSPPPTPGPADLAISKTASPNPVLTGGTLTYTINVNNNGPNSAANVQVSDPLPSGTTFSSCTTSQGTCVGPGVGTNGTVRANLGTMLSTGSAVVTIVVHVDAPGNSSITNTATVTSTTPDQDNSNNSSSVTTTVNP